MTGRSILRLLPPALVVVGALGACSDDSALGSATTTGSGTVVDVNALDNRFEAPTITIEAGTTVRFVNAGRNDHNVIPETGDEWGVQQTEFGPGAEYSHVFDTPGTYLYVCTIHGVITDGEGIGMFGTIDVTAG